MLSIFEFKAQYIKFKQRLVSLSSLMELIYGEYENDFAYLTISW